MPKPEADFPLEPEQVLKLLKLAHSYHDEADACRKAKAHLASCVTVAASLEAMLTAVVNVFCDEICQTRSVATGSLKLRNLLKWTLADLLKVTKEAQLLPERLNLRAELDRRAVKNPVQTDKILHVRNLLHPGRCVREGSENLITLEELDVLYATCHAAYDYLGKKLRGKYPDLPALKTTL